MVRKDHGVGQDDCGWLWTIVTLDGSTVGDGAVFYLRFICSSATSPLTDEIVATNSPKRASTLNWTTSSLLCAVFLVTAEKKTKKQQPGGEGYLQNLKPEPETKRK